MSEIVRCARAMAAGADVRDFAFAVDGDRIAATGTFDELQAAYADASVRTFGEDVIVVPGFINGHSHAYQILLRGWADDLTFERWRSDALYKIVPGLSPDDVYRTFCSAFREMLAAGITTVAEFFYLNGAGNAHAERAIEAANDCGIRLVFARTWMDAQYAPDAFREDIDTAAKRTQDLMAAFPQTHICIAPHSLHAASPDMLRAAAAFAADKQCMMHVHAAEAAYEGAQTYERFGHTPIALLDELGALNERTVAIHAIYIDEREKQLLAQRGARVIHNPMTNQYLGDGICDVTSLQSLGVTMGLGTDADVKPSIFEEMRAASLLQKIARLDGSALGAQTAFDMGTAQGARALNVDAGDLSAGMYADFAVVDAAGIDSWSPAVNALVYRAENGWVRQTFVGGRSVFEK
ncbi:MAG TPA: amidohydrolase family protein [Candidatus Baltobacteraceae bacterium]|nr:amidohydrolase family protein [Candidatus Baltobacteraceae bacterium]